MTLKRTLLVLLVGALLVVGWMATLPNGETHQVTDRSLVRTAEFRGRLEAEDSLTFGPPGGIRSQWNFKISYMAPEGRQIASGDRLVAFDATELSILLIEARSALETAQVNLEKQSRSRHLEQEDRDLSLAEAEAEAKKARLKTEAPEDLVASQENQKAHIDLETTQKKLVYLKATDLAQSEEAKRNLENLRNLVAQKTSLVSQLNREIDSLTIPAPSTGTVVYATNWRREKSKVGDQVNRMQKVVSLPNLDRLRASAQIDEIFAAEIEVGQRVTFTMDSFPDDQFEGTIRTINPAIQQRSWRDPRKVLSVDIQLTNADPERMRPGMRIQGDLEIFRTEEVPTLPITSISWQDGKAAVQVRRWFGSKTITPELGRRDDAWVEILEGLEAGDTILATDEAYS